jgi:hypothetical protein
MRRANPTARAPSLVAWTGRRSAVIAEHARIHPQRMTFGAAGRVTVGHQQIERWMS